MADALITAAILADNGHHMEGWDWVWGSLMMLLWVAILVGAVWFLVSRAHARGGDRTHRAREILDERYARGELETEEYRERINELR